MNRLVIVGNGFDLAHGLPTSYKNFIDDYWSDIKDSDHNDGLIEFDLNFKIEFQNFNNINDLAKKIMSFSDLIKFEGAEIFSEYGNNYSTGKYPRKHLLIYKNVFFNSINQKCIENWVDIENLFYSELKQIVNATPKSLSVNEEDVHEVKKEKVIKLNAEFEKVKNLFENYLIEKVETNYQYQINEDVIPSFSILCRKLNLSTTDEDYLKEFRKEDINHLVEIDNLICSSSSRREDVNNGKIPIQNLFLNFNYTKTVDKYVELLNNKNPEGTSFLCGNTKQIQIHGRLNSISNKINFGFGDEMDEDYKLIENINDNEYLKFFKSFQYLQNNNYKNLLDFIDSEKFQLFIMGHSCGLSDRTLLNTIFEHTNCCSIKIYYHQREDGSDNYTEIVQNISRHFNKKKLMREKIVNKTLCKPLPQIKLSKKQ